MNHNLKENSVPIWEKRIVEGLLINLELAPGTAEYEQYANAPSSQHTKDHNPSGIPLYQPSYPGVLKPLKCSCCKSVFELRDELVVHYSSEWHKANLKRSIAGLNCVTYEQFINGNLDIQKDIEGELSSGDEDENVDEEKSRIQRKPKVFFLNADKEVISIYRSVLHHKKANLSSETELLNRAYSVPHKLHWTIILIGGGHFAGGEFVGESIKAKKTFHNYTVRAKQGGNQSSKDNKNATSQPKSAGASLRRKNELTFNQNIKDLLEEWKVILDKCNLVFFKCPKSSYHLLFGGQCSPLNVNDERVRTIPFSTKKPTLDEVWKVFDTLSRIYTHGKTSDLAMEMLKEKAATKKESTSPLKTNSTKAKSKKLTKEKLAEIDTHQEESSSSEESVERLTTSFETITTNLLAEPFGPSAENERIQNKSLRKKRISERKDSSENIVVKTNEFKDSSREMKKVENFVYTACRRGNIEELKAFHQFFELRDYTEVSDMLPHHVVSTILSEVENCNWRFFKFGIQEKTPLHVAAENGHKEVLWWMLDNGCDPCSKNKLNETPFLTTKVKEVRNHFRRYMAANPDKYDYEKANIPGPLLAEQENQLKIKKEDKKKHQKKVKREKEKVLRKEEEMRRKEEAAKMKEEEVLKSKEEEEKQKFLMLSDREKRALAAERRMLAAMTSLETPAEEKTILRCFQCGKDLNKIIVYEYYDFKFCSGSCVAEHRKKNRS